jgi:hypothetical protein
MVGINMTQGAVTEHLFTLIAKQVKEHGVVVWYDPERAYVSAVELLNLPNTTVARYQGSFFQLRHEIDHLLNGQQAPRLVVYVPKDRGQTDHALVELEAAGVIMQPGQQPPNRNTRRGRDCDLVTSDGWRAMPDKWRVTSDE